MWMERFVVPMRAALSLVGVLCALLVCRLVWPTHYVAMGTYSAPARLFGILGEDDLIVVDHLPDHESFNYTAFVDR